METTLSNPYHPPALSLLLPAPSESTDPLHVWWSRTLSLRAWVNELSQLTAESATTVSGETVLPGFGSSLGDLLAPLEGPQLSILPTPDFARASWELFYANQRAPLGGSQGL